MSFLLETSILRENSWWGGDHKELSGEILPRDKSS